MPTHVEAQITGNVWKIEKRVGDQLEGRLHLVDADLERAPVLKAVLHYTPPHPGAPPPRILFQSFLI